jgi:hypothetical protein
MPDDAVIGDIVGGGDDHPRSSVSAWIVSGAGGEGNGSSLWDHAIWGSRDGCFSVGRIAEAIAQTLDSASSAANFARTALIAGAKSCWGGKDCLRASFITAAGDRR